MTAPEVAQLLHAKETKRGQKWIAKCPSHPDGHPSLTIMTGKVKVLLTCFAGCEYDAIVESLGLRKHDLYYDAEIREETRRRLLGERRLERLLKQYSLCLFLSALETPAYWRAAARRIGIKHNKLYTELYPDLAEEKIRMRQVYAKIERVGMDAMWNEYWREHEAGN